MGEKGSGSVNSLSSQKWDSIFTQIVQSLRKKSDKYPLLINKYLIKSNQNYFERGKKPMRYIHGVFSPASCKLVKDFQ